MEFKVRPAETGDKQGWKLTLNGQEVSIAHLALENPRYGKLEYGMRPEGYDAPVFFQKGGGGATTLLYTRRDGELWVGLVLENRPHLSDQPVLCIAGGFLKDAESHLRAQARESKAETGLDTTGARELPGIPTVSDRAFFAADLEKGEGVHSYAMEVAESMTVDGNDGTLRLHHNDTAPAAIANVRFLPWKQAIRESPDSLAHSAIARLLAVLL